MVISGEPLTPDAPPPVCAVGDSDQFPGADLIGLDDKRLSATINSRSPPIRASADSVSVPTTPPTSGRRFIGFNARECAAIQHEAIRFHMPWIAAPCRGFMIVGCLVLVFQRHRRRAMQIFEACGPARVCRAVPAYHLLCTRLIMSVLPHSPRRASSSRPSIVAVIAKECFSAALMERARRRLPVQRPGTKSSRCQFHISYQCRQFHQNV